MALAIDNPIPDAAASPASAPAGSYSARGAGTFLDMYTSQLSTPTPTGSHQAAGAVPTTAAAEGTASDKNLTANLLPARTATRGLGRNSSSASTSASATIAAVMPPATQIPIPVPPVPEGAEAGAAEPTFVTQSIPVSTQDMPGGMAWQVSAGVMGVDQPAITPNLGAGTSATDGCPAQPATRYTALLTTQEATAAKTAMVATTMTETDATGLPIAAAGTASLSDSPLLAPAPQPVASQIDAESLDVPAFPSSLFPSSFTTEAQAIPEAAGSDVAGTDAPTGEVKPDPASGSPAATGTTPPQDVAFNASISPVITTVIGGADPTAKAVSAGLPSSSVAAASGKQSSRPAVNLETAVRTSASDALAQSSAELFTSQSLPDTPALHAITRERPISGAGSAIQSGTSSDAAIPAQKNSVNSLRAPADPGTHASTGSAGSAGPNPANGGTNQDPPSNAGGDTSDPNARHGSAGTSSGAAVAAPPDAPVPTVFSDAVLSATSAGAAPASTPANNNPAPPQPSEARPNPASADASVREPAAEPAALAPVQMAQIMNRAAQSEMRIGLNTASFGNVEVHAVVQASEVGVAIGSEKGDLRSLLANELPGIANNLQQQNLRLNPVNFHQGFGFSGNLSSGGGDAQPKYFAAPRAVPSELVEARADDSGFARSEMKGTGPTGLNILA